MWQNRSSPFGKFQIIIWNFSSSELQETHFRAFYSFTSLLLQRTIFNNFISIFFQAILLYYIFVFIFQNSKQVNFMVYICGWGSLPVRFKIRFLEPCWVCAPPRNVMTSVLLVFVQRSFLLIAYKFVLKRVVFNCIQGIFQHYF